MSSFSENLKFAMESKGVISKELADKSGIKYDTIISYLKKEGPEPSAVKACRIAQVLGVSVEYLVTGKDSSVPKSIKPEVLSILNTLNYLASKDLSFVKTLAERLKR